jgi:transcriptional antiterminator RfaH
MIDRRAAKNGAKGMKFAVKIRRICVFYASVTNRRRREIPLPVGVKVERRASVRAFFVRPAFRLKLKLRLLNQPWAWGDQVMPILKHQPDTHPEDLLDAAEPNAGRRWWLAYTLSRREKDLMRRLASVGTSFYGPTYSKGHRSPNGRLRIVQAPLFPNYVFLFGDEEARRTALETNCVSRVEPIAVSVPLSEELRRLRMVLGGNRPVTPEHQLEPGEPVSIRSGPFRGLSGTLVKREKEHRLVVAVNFIQQGASIEVFDFEVEAA